MNNCQVCKSYAINHDCHGRDGTDENLCDVCYWRKRAAPLQPEKAPKPLFLVEIYRRKLRELDASTHAPTVNGPDAVQPNSVAIELAAAILLEFESRYMDNAIYEGYLEDGWSKEDLERRETITKVLAVGILHTLINSDDYVLLRGEK